VALGRLGEGIAARFLRGRGHQILGERLRIRHGEIDLVTRSGSHLYFVEVKTRRVAAERDRFGGGFGAITVRKQRRMQRTAEVLIARHGWSGLNPHFAVLTVEALPQRRRVHFLPDAFDAAP
jgi:putative endonuclease